MGGGLTMRVYGIMGRIIILFGTMRGGGGVGECIAPWGCMKVYSIMRTWG